MEKPGFFLMLKQTAKARSKRFSRKATLFPKNIKEKKKNLQKKVVASPAFKEATEDQEQMAFIEWCLLHPILKKCVLHIPNGGSRHIIEAAKLKRMGTRKGVSDILIPYPSKGFHGLWIEFKRRNIKIKPSKEQLEWLDLMKEYGYATFIAYGWDSARNYILKEYL